MANTNEFVINDREKFELISVIPTACSYIRYLSRWINI